MLRTLLCIIMGLGLLYIAVTRLDPELTEEERKMIEEEVYRSEWAERWASAFATSPEVKDRIKRWVARTIARRIL
jgi:hypothetical protein